ncbi:unnamed protein product [Rotaria magnacalcarata]|uniref:polynucleotide adenylyltransferase n=4 Tax=Rotaria magnacalcarata TaxID=392030 RepID=A0A816N9N3_9BILA|nr:unnamed protein product [Rotaria magnacalcarata]CAF1231294.1 unnamed protein product [Rotaria magnacalcarata]CAF1918603.1 unnamed protein product [Rotaria magnacalcarata]CAF2028826.1 unnamed protein product [Rotaria magnacalcarata]CAF2192612.1 unnamed protein product [Rotaria magnacalcarata]
MSSTDDSYSMASSLPSSLDQTPLSSLSAASSYASLVNCDDTISMHNEKHHHQQQQHFNRKPKRNSPTNESKLSPTSDSNNMNNKINNGFNHNYSTNNKRTSYSTLQNRHVNKLCSILEEPIEIHGQGNFPTLNIVSKDFLIELRRAFHLNNIDIKDVRLNGGAASYVLTNDKSFSYSDIDFIFRCDLSSELTWTQIKTTVCECLYRHISSTNASSSSQLLFSPIIIQAAYVEKVVRVINPSNNDSWALMSLCNVNGQNIELKFVDRMKRQFQFSVDSFQILLDPLLDHYEELIKYQQPTNKKQAQYYQYHHHRHYKQQYDYRLSRNNRYLSSSYNLPTISVECVYGSFENALTHLNRRLIATTSPERICGGGLLKYCLLLTRDYRPYDNGIASWQLEKLMCSRFFIDYADINEQEYKLLAFLSSHFSNDDSAKYRYLLQLRLIIERSTVCLMAHERNLTLTLITQLATDYYYRLYDEYNIYSLMGETTTAEVTVPNSITIDVIYHNEWDEWKSLYTPQKKQIQSQQDN